MNFLLYLLSALVESKQEMELSLFESAKEVPIHVLELVCGLADTTIPLQSSAVLICIGCSVVSEQNINPCI